MNIDPWKNFEVHKLNRNCAESFQYRGDVVDLGCGTAPFKDYILKTANSYIGVDWNNSLHDQSNIDIFADLTAPLPLSDSIADIVTSFHVLEHLPEPSGFLKEAFRILRPGGQMFITVPFMWHIHEAPHDYFRFTRYGLDYLFRRSGFRDVTIKETTGFWFMMALKLNYHTARWRLGRLKITLVPFWWLTQKVSIFLDKHNHHPQEAGGYAVWATKPSTSS